MTSKEQEELREIATVQVNAGLKIRDCMEILDMGGSKDAPHIIAAYAKLRQAFNIHDRIRARLEALYTKKHSHKGGALCI